MAANPRVVRGSVHTQFRICVHFIVATALAGAVIVASQGSSSRWTAAGLVATPRATVEGEREGTLTAEAGARLVEVTGAFDRAGASAPSVALPDVNLSGWVTVEGLTVTQRSGVMAVGVKDNTGACSYLFPHLRVRGVTSRLADAAGNGIELKKNEEKDPAVVTLLKRPAQLCLVFQIPSGPLRTVTLRVGSDEFRVTVGNGKD